MKILIVEDEEPKLRHIVKCLESLLDQATLMPARSVRSGIIALETEAYDLVILDMSLPTFDIEGAETGGRPQGFGGTELMREIEMSQIAVPVLVLTGYEAFTRAGGEVGLDAMAQDLSDEFPENFRGILHFNSAYGDWQQKLGAALMKLGLIAK